MRKNVLTLTSTPSDAVRRISASGTSGAAAAAGAVEAISVDAMWRWVIICVVIEDGGSVRW